MESLLNPDVQTIEKAMEKIDGTLKLERELMLELARVRVSLHAGDNLGLRAARAVLQHHHRDSAEQAPQEDQQGLRHHERSRAAHVDRRRLTRCLGNAFDR